MTSLSLSLPLSLSLSLYPAGGGGAVAIRAVGGDEEESGAGSGNHFRRREGRERGEYQKTISSSRDGNGPGWATESGNAMVVASHHGHLHSALTFSDAYTDVLFQTIWRWRWRWRWSKWGGCGCVGGGAGRDVRRADSWPRSHRFHGGGGSDPLAARPGPARWRSNRPDRVLHRGHPSAQHHQTRCGSVGPPTTYRLPPMIHFNFQLFPHPPFPIPHPPSTIPHPPSPNAFPDFCFYTKARWCGRAPAPNLTPPPTQSYARYDSTHLLHAPPKVQ